MLGRVYEYLLSQYASAEGEKDSEFYPPRCMGKFLVERPEPSRGRVYAPCCGSAGRVVPSVERIRAHAYGTRRGGALTRPRADSSLYGQESHDTTAPKGAARRAPEEALRIRDDVACVQAVQAVLAQRAPGAARPDEEHAHAVRQSISRAVAPEGVVDILAAASLVSPTSRSSPRRSWPRCATCHRGSR